MIPPSDLYTTLLQDGGKIVLLVVDGLGGLPMVPGGPTELEAAETPNLDALVRAGTCGAVHPVARGVTPGSGPGHLALFGLDPLRYVVGRGVVDAMGVEPRIRAGDVCARGNFCTVDDAGVVVDRRAGRLASDEGRRLVDKLATIEIPGLECILRHVAEYRFVLVLRGQNLDGDINDTDPGRTGVLPLDAKPRSAQAAQTAERVNQFISRARAILSDEARANMLLLRGIDSTPQLPSLKHEFGLKGAALALYPTYKGLARLVGMDVLECGTTLSSQLDVLASCWNDYDFFFIHVKAADSRGEDGDFQGKVRVIEDVDAHLPRIRSLSPAVLVVTGDHSTPARMRGHSWHPVPVAFAADTCLPDSAVAFGERACLSGGLGQFESKWLMPLMLAHAGRLGKFGA